MSPAPLRWAWGAAIDRVAERFAGVATAAQIDLVQLLAARFVERHGYWAEAAGMQPAHLLRFQPHMLERRGLAWRMTPETHVVGFPSAGHLITELMPEHSGYRGAPMVYQMMRKGGLKPLFGPERKALLDAPYDLSLRPSPNGSSVNGSSVNGAIITLNGEDPHDR